MTDSVHIRAIVLAAGRSARFGANKLLAPFRGEALILAAMRAARAAIPGNVMLVTGHDAARIADAAGDLADVTVHNPDYERGLGSSIACGIGRCRDADGVMILLADQPLVTADHLRAIIANWSGAATAIVASRYADCLGVPALFGSGLFDDLCALQGDRGARDLLRSGRYRVVAVDCEAAAIDVDTRDDLARCLSSGS